MSFQREQRPKLNIPWTQTDRLVHAAGVVGLALLIGLPIFAWSGLPDEIPIHFGISGDPDSWGSREAIWLLPAVGLVMWAAMAVLTRFPHAYNYPWVITRENAEDLYRLSRSMVIWLNAGITLLFAYIQWGTLRAATGDVDGLGALIVPVAIIGIFGTIGYFMWASSKKARPVSR
jgi:uncharacterized membrane protein